MERRNERVAKQSSDVFHVLMNRWILCGVPEGIERIGEFPPEFVDQGFRVSGGSFRLAGVLLLLEMQLEFQPKCLGLAGHIFP